MLLLARLMVRSEMTATLAEAAATSTGAAWPLLAPLVGVPGTFVTGSATVGLVGAEGDVLRRTLGVTVGYALLGGSLALLLV